MRTINSPFVIYQASHPLFSQEYSELQLWPWGLGDLGRMDIYFQGAGSTGDYFRGAKEQAHNFGDIGTLAKKQKNNKEKPPFCLIF